MKSVALNKKMDKFYVKPKKNLVSTNPSTSKATTTSRTSAEIFQSSSNGKRLGVGNICSKIRHKIEDNLTPKISSKLYKTGKHSKSLTALSSIGASSGKYTLTNKNSVGNETTSSDIRKVKLKANAKLANSNEKPNPYAECYNTAKDISYFAKSSLTSYADSDEDETQMSLNLAKTSLEDEIFQELEKASHDENKLNEVLKTFDKIIFDYNDPLVQEKSKLTIENESDNIKSEVDEIPNVKDSIENVLNSSIEIFNLPEHEFNNSTNIKSCCVKSEQTEIQLDNNASEFKKLEKSSSTLSLTRRKCYQSPNSPCLRQMRHAFAKQQRSKSVWELSNSSKIPILKAMPLKTRSKSFCYHDSEVSSNNLKSLENLKPLKTTKQLENTQTAATVQNAQKLRKQKSIDRKDRSLVSNASVKIKNETKTPNKTSTNVKTLQSKGISSKAKRTTSVPNINVASKTNMSSSVTRQIKKNDELLDKCLEKGQQILRKVESISTHRIQPSSHGKKSVIRTKSNSSNKISKDNLTLKRKQWLNKLNYANEEKIVTPKLESCKIIPPVLGETSDKHAELLVQVTNATLLNTTRQRIITEEAQLKRTHNSTQQLNLTTKNHESDSDDSGHISNENMEIAINHTSHSSSSASLCETSSTSSANDSLVDNSESNGVVTKSLKMSEVLQKFERKSQMETTQVNSNENWIYAFEKSQSKSNKIFNIAANTVIPKTNISLTTAKDSVDSRFCTTYKVAEVESVSLIRTHVEIYPNYTKEVTIRLQ